MPSKVESYIHIDNISKTFGPVVALRNVNLEIRKGEIHAIIGENGAGKSTLLKILSGELKQDAGKVFLAGQDIASLGEAIRQKVKMVHQELTVFDNLTVAENLFPDYIFNKRRGLIDYKQLHQRAKEQLHLFEVNISPSEKMGDLSVAEQQIVEILRVTSLYPEVVIFDEPTSSLNQKEVEVLNSLLQKLKQKQITILYISHRIKEVLEISDRITVLKNGTNVKTLDNESLESAQVINLMIGREIESFFDLDSQKAHARIEKGKPILEMKGVSNGYSLAGINLQIFDKEILGIFGLEGSGTSDLSRLLFCLDKPEKGTLVLQDRAHARLTPLKMIENGFSYLSSDRKKSGLFLQLAAYENILCPNLKRLSTNSFVNREGILQEAALYVDKMGVVIPSVRARANTLSGGNQQKLMLSVCLSTEPKCLILNDPTRGIDVGAKAEIYRIINNLSERVSVVIFSSELPELIALCDRLLIMKTKKIVAELPKSEFDEERIMTLAAGVADL